MESVFFTSSLTWNVTVIVLLLTIVYAGFPWAAIPLTSTFLLSITPDTGAVTV